MKLISIVAIVCHCSKHFAEKLVLHFAYNKMTWMEFTIQLCEIHTTELQCIYTGYIVIHSCSMFWTVDSHGRNYRHINFKSLTNKTFTSIGTMVKCMIQPGIENHFGTHNNHKSSAPEDTESKYIPKRQHKFGSSSVYLIPVLEAACNIKSKLAYYTIKFSFDMKIN